MSRVTLASKWYIFIIILVIDFSSGQQQKKQNVGDQIATGLASALLNTLFPQLNTRNDNFDIRQQPSFSNIPVLTASRTDLAPSPIFGLGNGGGRGSSTLDLQSFPGAAPFLTNGNAGNDIFPAFSQSQSGSFLAPPSLSSNLRPSGSNPLSGSQITGNLLEDFSRIGILPTLINIARPAISRNSILSPITSPSSSGPALPIQRPVITAPGGIIQPTPQGLAPNQGLLPPPWPLPGEGVNASDLRLQSSLFVAQPPSASSALLQQLPASQIAALQQLTPLQTAALLQQSQVQQWPTNGFPQPIPPAQQFLGPALWSLPQVPQQLGAGSSAKAKLITGATADEENFGSNCPQCLPIDLLRLSGPWVQVYGNPQALRTIYTSIAHLQSLYGDDSVQTTDLAAIQPTCVGVQFSKPQNHGRRRESTLNLYFRDDTNTRQLHEAVGRVKQDLDASPTAVNFKLPAFDLPMCLVKAGPETSTMYGYVVLAETIGTNRCRSYHVFTRQADSFFRDHNLEVAAFLKSQVEENSVKPVSVLPYPELCQLQNIAKIS